VDGDWFVGRQAELERVVDRARRVSAGLQTVLLGGPPGLGKTALLHRIAAELSGFTVLWAVGDSWESEVPYGLVSQLVSPTRPRYHADYPLLFGLGAPDISPHHVGAELVDLIGQLDSRGPVAMIIDDLPAADPLSLRALAFALRRMREAHALLLVAARPAPDDAAPADWRLMLPVELAEVQVGEFSRDEVMWLAHRHGIPWLPSTRLDWLARYTGGHPFYLHQLLTHVDHARLLADVGSAIAPPRPVVSAIGRQVQALPPASARLLEALAVLDGRYPLAVVAELAGIEGELPDDAMVPLVTENLVRTWPHLPSTPVRVRYPVQRDAIYQTIAPNRRRRLHTAALTWSHGRAAWVHKVAASDRMDVHLAADLETAANGVLREGRPARAATFLLWAADLSGFPPDRERRTLHAAAHLLWNYRFSRAEALFAEVESAADSPLRSCILGRYSMMRGWYSAAETAFHRALATPGSDGWVRMLATTGLASLYCWLGRGGESAAGARQALDTVPDLHPDLARLARQYLATAVLHTSGAVAAIAEIDRQLRLPERASLARGADADALAWRSLLRGLAGQPAAAVEDADAVQRLIESAAVAEVEVSQQYCLAWAQYLLGQWEEAAANASHAITLTAAGGRSWAHAYTHMMSALVAAGRGEWDLADAAATETRRWVRALGPPQYVVFSAMATAAVAQARGDHHSVLRALRPLTSLADVSGWVLAYEPWWRVMAAEALIAQGSLAGAQAAVDRLAGLAAGMPVLGPVVAWLAGSLHAARGDDEAALRLFADGADAPDALPLYAALLDEAHGRLLVQARQWRAGLDRLQRAHRGFTAIGATPFAERCAALLAASGVRPSQQNTGPLLVLTERERAIAELVTRGLTNQEVAERLFISSKTVSHHLGRIFAKLGVASRRELRDLAGSTTDAGRAPGPPRPPKPPAPPTQAGGPSAPQPRPPSPPAGRRGGRSVAGPRPPADPD
jgi:DNA-binding CsgD family transcriptional regulator/tetratricopeptide (TPR) repeat protein/DNA polymerase III delta prime subunit